MLNWLGCFLADVALYVAKHSAGLASSAGMHQMKEPEELRKLMKKENRVWNLYQRDSYI